MGDFLAFRRMITPFIIQAIFWIGVAFSFIGGIVIIVLAATQNYIAVGLLVGFGMMIIGPFVARIQCELLILSFRIHDNLVDINRKTKAQETNA